MRREPSASSVKRPARARTENFDRTEASAPSAVSSENSPKDRARQNGDRQYAETPRKRNASHVLAVLISLSFSAFLAVMLYTVAAQS